MRTLMRLPPHHDGSELYVSDPHPQLGELVAVFVRVPRWVDVRQVWVRSRPDGTLHLREGVPDRVEEHDVIWRCELPIHNQVTRYRFQLRSPGGLSWLTAAGVSRWEPPESTDFCLTTFAGPPDWVSNSVFYQIFPDCFANSGATREWPEWSLRSAWDDPVSTDWRVSIRQVYGGDLQGIAERLDHMERLGVNALYLTPFFSAPSSHRYNADDFTHVDPLLGGDEGLAMLSAEVHRRGMRILGDLTLHHCGSTHQWFQSAHELGQAAATSEYFPWEGTDFAYCRGIPTLPKLDYRSSRVRQAMVTGSNSVVTRWLRPPFELDGWRIDLANMVGRYRDSDENKPIARATRRAMSKVNPATYLVGEHMYDASPDLLGDGWHGVTNYSGFTWPVLGWLGDVELLGRAWFMGNPVMPSFSGQDVAEALDAYRANAPWTAATHALNLLGSHDTPRWRTVARDVETAVVGVGLLMSYPGVPSMLYGDEIGLTGSKGDLARSPMVWDESRWDTALFEEYRRLIHLRCEHVAFSRGGFRWVHVGEDVLIFLRESASQRLLVRASRRAHRPVPLPPELLLGCRTASAALLYGQVPLRERPDGVAEVPGEGPSFEVWELDAAPASTA